MLENTLFADEKCNERKENNFLFPILEYYNLVYVDAY